MQQAIFSAIVGEGEQEREANLKPGSGFGLQLEGLRFRVLASWQPLFVCWSDQRTPYSVDTPDILM